MTPRRFHTTSLEQPSALLPTNAPARAARWTAWLLLGVFAAAVAFVCLVKLPEGVLVPFQLEPEAGAHSVLAPLAGEVAAVRVHEGQEVKAGDELLALRSDEVRNWQLSLRQARADRRVLAERPPKPGADQAAEVEKIEAQVATLEKQLEHCDGETFSMRAPYDAIVLSLHQRDAGSLVNTGSELCELVRAGDRLRARLSIPERGLARLQPGHVVLLRFEAYPYERYGSVPAVLVWISPVGVMGPEGTTFPATAKLGAAPAQSRVKPGLGMRGQAHILVGRRTLLEKFLEPLRALKEGNAPL
jgi:multidrug efflux pump subunit AcrA (membrane-fusion protein)